MLTYLKDTIRFDPKLRWLLLAGLVIQVVTSVTAIGFSNFDQHFSIIEFSSWQLGRENAAHYAFELEAKIRPTLQVYLFSGYYKACMALHIADPYQQLLILRIIVGLLMFAGFNLISFFYFGRGDRRILYCVLLMLNFSWLFPYTRTLFNSEMMSGLFLFASICLYDARRKKHPSFLFLAFVGLLFSLAFYFRFQMGLALAGFALWFILFDRNYQRLFPLALGFLAGALFNTWLDYMFYHEFVISPLRYFQWNIVEGRSAEFGTSSVLKYIGFFVAVIVVPPISIILIWYTLKTYVVRYDHPFFLAILFFILGHCLIGHKEERFMYPLLGATPVVVGYGLPALISFYHRCRPWIAAAIRTLLAISVALDVILLILFTSIPYSQTIYFSKLLKNRFEDQPTTIYCLYRTPFETMSKIPIVFYKKEAKQLDLRRVTYVDSLRSLSGSNILVTTTFNESKKRRGLFDSLGYKPVAYSSKLLWEINTLLQSRKIATINDIWVLYKKE